MPRSRWPAAVLTVFIAVFACLAAAVGAAAVLVDRTGLGVAIILASLVTLGTVCCTRAFRDPVDRRA